MHTTDSYMLLRRSGDGWMSTGHPLPKAYVQLQSYRDVQSSFDTVLFSNKSFLLLCLALPSNSTEIIFITFSLITGCGQQRDFPIEWRTRSLFPLSPPAQISLTFNNFAKRPERLLLHLSYDTSLYFALLKKAIWLQSLVAQNFPVGG